MMLINDSHTLVWPLNSPDLHPVDYGVSAILQDRINRNQIKDVQELCQCIEKCDSLDQRVINSAVTE